MSHDFAIDVLGAEAAGYTDAVTVKAVQEKLMEISNALPASDARKAQFNPGPIDGIPGPKTSSAVRALQTQNGVPATGIIDDWVLRMFHIQAPGGFFDGLKSLFGAKSETPEVPLPSKLPAAHVPPSSARSTTIAPASDVPLSQASVLPATIASVPTWQAAIAALGAVAVGIGMYKAFKPGHA